MPSNFPSRSHRFASRGVPRRGRSGGWFGGKGRNAKRGRRPAAVPFGIQRLEPRLALSVAPTSVDDFRRAADAAAAMSGSQPANSVRAAAVSAAATTAPGAPTNVVATAGTGQATVTWTAPSSNGGATIVNYVVEHSSNGGKNWTKVSSPLSSSTTRTVSNLTNGTSYVFRVTAQNVKGSSSPAVSQSAVTPRTVPNAPTAVTVVADKQAAFLTWKAPAVNGGAAVTDYKVEFSTDKGKTWKTFVDGVSASPSARVSGLQSASRYLFRVSAVNVAGSGAPVATTTEMAPLAATAPLAPSSVTATAGRREVTLSWTPPTDTGGSPITDYRIESSADSGKTWQTFNDGVSTTASAKVTGLVAGTSYVFRVSAVNAVGAGASLRSLAATPLAPAAPAAPAAPTVQAGDRGVGLAWTAPANDGGSPVTDYRVEYSANGGKTWTTFSDGTSPFPGAEVTGLTNGTAYVFRVTAVNAVGAGTASSASVSATPAPAVLPGAPSGVKGIASGRGQVTVSWTAPTGPGANQITNYRVEYLLDNGSSATWKTFTTTTKATSANVTGLFNGAYYLFRVSAVSPAGLGPASANSQRVLVVAPLW